LLTLLRVDLISESHERIIIVICSCTSRKEEYDAW